MKKVFPILFLMIILLSGCGHLNSNKSDKNYKAEITKHNISINNKIKENSQIQSYINHFKRVFPKAQIITKSICNLDDDNIKDLVIVYDNYDESTDKITKSNVCILTDTTMNSLILGREHNLEFVKGSNSLKVSQNPKKIILSLHDPQKNKNVQFSLTVTINKNKNATNIKITTK